MAIPKAVPAGQKPVYVEVLGNTGWRRVWGAGNVNVAREVVKNQRKKGHDAVRIVDKRRVRERTSKFESMTSRGCNAQGPFRE